MKRAITAVFLALALVFVSIGATACAKDELPVPTNILIDDYYRMTWDAVEGSRGYLVGITDTAGEYTEKTARRANYSLSTLAEGDYEIRIKAVGEDERSDSPWTDVIYFHKDYENGCLYEQQANGTEYRLIGSGTASGVVEVGDLYRGKPVTEIGDAAFRNSSVEEVVIGNNVARVGASAFYGCAKLRKVTIPESVVEIGDAAFQACYILNDVVLPDTITYISNNAFNFCRGLTDITFSNVTAIGEYAFANCSALTEFSIPDCVETIGTAAFLNDNALESVSFGENVREIGNMAFANNAALKTLNFAQTGVLQSIGEEAFYGCSALESVDIPEGVTTIQNDAFQKCEKLANITLPDSITQIGQYAFYSTAVYLAAEQSGETYVYVGDWLVDVVQERKTNLVVVGDETTPENVRDENFVPLRNDIVGIADAVFFYNSTLQRVFLPDSVELIGNSTFSTCDALWFFEAKSTSSLRVIGPGAFMECKTLRTVYLGNALESIESYAFYNCLVLENNSISSIIPDTVTHIGMLAFVGTAMYENADEYGVVYAGDWVIGYEGYDESMIYMYYLATGNSDYAESLLPDLSSVTYVLLNNEVRGIADFAFYGHINLEQVDGMSSARYLGEGAFYGCKNLGSVNLNTSLSSVEDFTFYGCESIFRVSLPPLVSSIGRSAFYNCTQISEISFTGRRLESIGDFAFYNCINLPSINFGTALTDIGRYAFYNCASLSEIVLPDTLLRVEDCAFYGCSKVASVTFGQELSSIGDYAFANCTGLKQIALPDSLREIGNSAFRGCEGVLALDFGNGVETIGDYAFAGILGLQSVALPASVRSIGTQAFRGCVSLQQILLPAGTEQIGLHAFYGDLQATIYTDVQNDAVRWEEYWNSSYRPFITNCSFSEDGTYVVSVTVPQGGFSYVNASNVVSAPMRDGYVFAGWALSAGGQVAYSADQIGQAAPGTVLYAVWQQA